MMTWRLHHFDAYGEDCSLSACLTLTCNPLVCIVAADLVEMMCTDKTGSAICWTEVKTVFVPSAGTGAAGLQELLSSDILLCLAFSVLILQILVLLSPRRAF